MFVPCRLDKYLHDATSLPLVELRGAIARGEAELRTQGETETVRTAEQLVFDRDQVFFRDRLVSPRAQHDHLILHKPVGVTTTRSDPDGRTDLLPWLAQMPQGLFPVGRLDRDTSGLLLLTSDGDLAQAILLPSHHTEKLYELHLDQELSPGDPRLPQLCEGVRVVGESDLLRANSVTIVKRSERTVLQLSLCQGRHRQIRKMCHALGLRLVALHRVAIGPLRVDGLEPGAFRQLRPDELEALWESTGGKRRVLLRKLAALARRAARSSARGRPEPRLDAWLAAHAVGTGLDMLESPHVTS